MARAMVGIPHPLTPRFAAGFLVAGAMICAFSGCRQSPVHKDPSLARVLSTPLRELESGYTVQAPDVLALRVEGKPELPERLTVQNDGSIHLSPSLRVEVDGKAIPEISRRIADAFEYGEVYRGDVDGPLDDFDQIGVYTLESCFGSNAKGVHVRTSSDL